MSPVDRSKGELRQMLANKDASADQIKAKLTALRVAQEHSRQELTKARQNLRQLLTLRQEAMLVLNGLLD
jgi:anthranilate phosphoribosyltransferase